MIDKDKLAIARTWIEKLANGVNPLNDELVKDDDIINNVHISRCLFYVCEIMGEIGTAQSSKRYLKPFSLTVEDTKEIPVNNPDGINNFVKVINEYVSQDMKPLAAGIVIKWLRYEGYLQEVERGNGHKTNIPTPKGIDIGISYEIRHNEDGSNYTRVIYGVDAQRFILNNIESISLFAKQ